MVRMRASSRTKISLTTCVCLADSLGLPDDDERQPCTDPTARLVSKCSYSIYHMQPCTLARYRTMTNMITPACRPAKARAIERARVRSRTRTMNVVVPCFH